MLKRCADNPIFPAKKGTWMEDQTANPDLLEYGDEYIIYFRGQQGGHDRIGLGKIAKDRFDGKTWHIHPVPVIDVGKPGAPDETHVLDPATVMVNGTVFLYYSAVSPACNRSICLATSEDGITFTKYPGNPVLIGGGPEIVYHDNRFYLYYWQDRGEKGGFDLHLSASEDGYTFTKQGSTAVLPAGNEGAWDSHTVETPRIFREGNTFFMMYCGSDKNDDYPADAGLAYSTDLIHWEKYANNPVFSRGDEGMWDEGAIWFTTVEKINGTYYLWYEGYGGGTARHDVYGTYLTEGRSQVGMAVADSRFTELINSIAG